MCTKRLCPRIHRGQAVIIELGARGFLGDERGDRRQFCSSPFYASPEQIMGRRPDGRSDIHAMCCTLYEQASGHPLFNCTTTEDIMNARLRGTPSFDGSSRKVAISNPASRRCHKGLKRPHRTPRRGNLFIGVIMNSMEEVLHEQKVTWLIANRQKDSIGLIDEIADINDQLANLKKQIDILQHRLIGESSKVASYTKQLKCN